MNRFVKPYLLLGSLLAFAAYLGHCIVVKNNSAEKKYRVQSLHKMKLIGLNFDAMNIDLEEYLGGKFREGFLEINDIYDLTSFEKRDEMLRDANREYFRITWRTKDGHFESKLIGNGVNGKFEWGNGDDLVFELTK